MNEEEIRKKVEELDKKTYQQIDKSIIIKYLNRLVEGVPISWKGIQITHDQIWAVGFIENEPLQFYIYHETQGLPHYLALQVPNDLVLEEYLKKLDENFKTIMKERGFIGSCVQRKGKPLIDILNDAILDDKNKLKD